jgi:hypothetical protein
LIDASHFKTLFSEAEDIEAASSLFFCAPSNRDLDKLFMSDPVCFSVICFEILPNPKTGVKTTMCHLLIARRAGRRDVLPVGAIISLFGVVMLLGRT